MNQDFWAKPTIASLCCGSPGSLSEIQTYDYFTNGRKEEGGTNGIAGQR